MSLLDEDNNNNCQRRSCEKNRMPIRTKKAKRISLPRAVVVTTLVLSLFSPSSFYEIRTVESFSAPTTSRAATHSSRWHRRKVVFKERQNRSVVNLSHSGHPIHMHVSDTLPSAENPKKYGDRKEQQKREKDRRELKNKIARSRDSILYFGQSGKKRRATSGRLEDEIIPAIVQSYTSALLQVSSKGCPSESVKGLIDPWEYRNVFRDASFPIQERIIGLLATLLQATTHISEEYFLYGKDRSKSKDDQQAQLGSFVERIDAVQSRLWETCSYLLKEMKSHEKPHILSPIAITALATALRKASATKSNPQYGTHGAEEINELIELVHQAKIAVSKENEIPDSETTDDVDRALLHAWNCYLSSLCDNGSFNHNPSDFGVKVATDLLLQANGEDSLVKLDISSYDTVMSIAGRLGNQTLVSTLWEDLIAKKTNQTSDRFLSLQPTSRTYNARLMATNDPRVRVAILDNEILPSMGFHGNHTSFSENSAFENTASIIDGFTLDMLLVPLLQANRKDDLFQLIDEWMARVTKHHHASCTNDKQQKINENKTQRAFQNALSAFFITLVQRNGDVRTARELWNRYMRLKIDNDVNDKTPSVCNSVIPERRHYNILLDGYARLVDQVRDRQGPNGELSKDLSKASDNQQRIWNTKSDDLEEAVSTSVFYQEVQEKAIRDGQELFALMMAQHNQQQNSRNKVGSDMYTKSTMIRLCRSGPEVQNLLERTFVVTASTNSDRPNGQSAWLPRSVVRAAVTTCGRLGDPSMACKIFEEFMFPEKESEKKRFFSNYRAFNSLLGALANGAKLENPRLDLLDSHKEQEEASYLLSKIHGLTCTEAVVRILNIMTSKNAQTYCVAASALQYASTEERSRLVPTETIDGDSQDEVNTPLALQIFFNATNDGIQADGRLINAIFRCYGDDIAGALNGWKTHIRKATYRHESRVRQAGSSSTKKKNMLAAYNGLLYVCGRAERPDIAVRIVYAMKNKEGLDPSENPYNNYKSGKTARQEALQSITKATEYSTVESKPAFRTWERIRLPKLDMVTQYENILYVECKKYDTRDRRMEKDKRVRIIV